MNIVVVDNFDTTFYKKNSDLLIKVLLQIAGFYNSENITFVTNHSYYIHCRKHDWGKPYEKKLIVGKSIQNANELLFHSCTWLTERILMKYMEEDILTYLKNHYNPRETRLVSATEVNGFERLFKEYNNNTIRQLKVFYNEHIKNVIHAPFAHSDCVIFLDFDGVFLKCTKNQDAVIPTDYILLPGIQHCDVVAFKERIRLTAFNKVKLLTERFNADVVICSNWFDIGTSGVEKLFHEAGWPAFKIAGKILHQYRREDAIREYCEYYNVYNYVILDDVFMDGFGERMIYCDHFFEDKEYREAHRVLLKN